MFKKMEIGGELLNDGILAAEVFLLLIKQFFLGF
jgi:hypothetical protein